MNICQLRAFGTRTDYDGYSTFQKGNETYLESPGYKYLWNDRTGAFWRWGETFDDDPQLSPFGPEIADIEISVGDCSGRCPWCYKSNQPGNGQHMKVETFEQVLDKMPTVMQVALGLTDLDANSDLLKILRACRARGVVPNFTTTGLFQDDKNMAMYKEILPYVGAVAVSVYPHTMKRAYDTICFLSHFVNQVNIHLLYHQDNLDFVYQVLDDVKNEGRLYNLNAVVLLGLKPKGRGENLTPLSQHRFTDLVEYAIDHEIPVGFDSCSCAKFLMARQVLGLSEELETYAEPCESGLFSIYVDSLANVWPCSFCEDREGVTPIPILEREDFLNDVWNGSEMKAWRERLLANDRKCPEYPID